MSIGKEPVSDTYSRGKEAVADQPVVLLVGVVGLLLLIDLINQLATGQIGVHNVVVLLWRGIVRGMVIAIAGVGLSMTYSILNFANFAHGDYVTSGAFVGWGASFVVAGFGSAVADLGALILVGAGGTVFAEDLSITVTNTPFAIVAGIVVAAIGTIVLALIIDRLVYRPMRGEGGIPLLIASIGVAFALRYLILFIYGPGVRSVAVNPPSFRPVIVDGPVSFSAHGITLVVCSLVLILAVHVLLQRTKLGTAMRAMSDNEDLALITGIPTERVIRWTWIIGAGLAGVAGYLFMLEAGTIAYNRGWLLLLLIFSAVILGGIGSIYGAIYGGLIIGIASRIALIWIPSDFARAAAFGIMVLVLLYRPSGLFAGRSTA